MGSDNSPVVALSIAVIFQFLAVVAVALREYARRTRKQDMTIDQYILFAALVSQAMKLKVRFTY